MSGSTAITSAPAGAGTAYATLAQLATFTGVAVGDLAADSSRLLDRATELIDDVTMDQIDLTDADHVEAAQNACCAQVEYWQSVGEGMDLEGPIQGYTAGKVQIQYGAGSNRITPAALAPRALRFLRRAGLLYRGGQLA